MKKFILAFISALTACCLMINITFCYASSFEDQLDELGYTVDEIIDLAQQNKFQSIPVSVMNLIWKNASYVRDSLGIPNLGGVYDYYLNQNTRYDSTDRFIDSVKGVADTLRKSIDFNAIKDDNGNITESKIDEIYHVSGKIHIIETPYDDSPATEKLIQVDINAPKTTVSSSKITKDDCYGNVSVSITDKLSGLTTSYSFPCCIRFAHIYTGFKYRNDIACNLCLEITYYVEDAKKTGNLYFGLSKTNSIDCVINGIYDNSTDYSSLFNSQFSRRYSTGSFGNTTTSGFTFGYMTTYFVCNNNLINNQFTESYFGTEYGLPPSFNFDNKFSANTVINNDNALDLGIDINAGFLALGASFDASLKAAVDAILNGYLNFYSNQPAPGDSFTNITNNSYNYIEMTEEKEPEPEQPSLPSVVPGGGCDFELPSSWLADYPDIEYEKEINIEDFDLSEYEEIEIPASDIEKTAFIAKMASDFLVSSGMFPVCILGLLIGLSWYFLGD